MGRPLGQSSIAIKLEFQDSRAKKSVASEGEHKLNSTIHVPVMCPVRGYERYQEEIDAAISSVLSSGQYILGPQVEEFEAEFASFCGVSSAVGVASGTDALSIALRAFGIGRSDAVITASHTAVATVAAIELVGATPVLVDIDEDTYTLDVQKLLDTLRAFPEVQKRCRPRAVIAVHLYGHPCEMMELRNLCDRYGLILIEDCAQAHGAEYRETRVGALGDIAAFSFYPTKNLGAFGDGGAIVTDNAEIAGKCRALREYGWGARYQSEIPGMNSRLDELQAAVLRVRLGYLDGEIDARRAIAARYCAELTDVVDVPKCRDYCKHAYHLFVVRSACRSDLEKALATQGVGTAIHYPQAVHQQPAYKGKILVGRGGLDVTERIVPEVLSLPMYPFLGRDELDTVISAVCKRAGTY